MLRTRYFFRIDDPVKCKEIMDKHGLTDNEVRFPFSSGSLYCDIHDAGGSISGITEEPFDAFVRSEIHKLNSNQNNESWEPG